MTLKIEAPGSSDITLEDVQYFITTTEGELSIWGPGEWMGGMLVRRTLPDWIFAAGCWRTLFVVER